MEYIQTVTTSIVVSDNRTFCLETNTSGPCTTRIAVGVTSGLFNPGCPESTFVFAQDAALVSWQPPLIKLGDASRGLSSQFQPSDSFLLGTTLVEYTDMSERHQSEQSRFRCSFNVCQRFCGVVNDLHCLLVTQVTVLEGINVLVTRIGHSFAYDSTVQTSSTTDYIVDSSGLFGMSTCASCARVYPQLCFSQVAQLSQRSMLTSHLALLSVYRSRAGCSFALCHHTDTMSHSWWT